MPLYTYECESCGNAVPWFDHMNDEKPKTIMCSRCWGESTRRFSKPQLTIFQDFVTNAPGKPIHVTNRRQLNELSRTHGIAPVTSDEVTTYKRKPMKVPSLEADFHRKRKEMNEDDIRAQLKSMGAI